MAYGVDIIGGKSLVNEKGVAGLSRMLRVRGNCDPAGAALEA